MRLAAAWHVLLLLRALAFLLWAAPSSYGQLPRMGSTCTPAMPPGSAVIAEPRRTAIVLRKMAAICHMRSSREIDDASVRHTP